MSGNTFGTLFRITTWGESHGAAVGVVVDGCPAGLLLDESDIQKTLTAGGRAERYNTPRKERIRQDTIRGISGKTTGAPYRSL